MRNLIKKTLINYLLEERKRWTKEEVISIAKNFTKMNDFKKESPSAYNAARKYKWLEDIKTFMVPAYNSLSFEEIVKIAKNFDNLTDFTKYYPNAYAQAKRKGYLPELEKFLKRKVVNWNENEIIKRAKKYNTITDFVSNESRAYAVAKKLGIWDDKIKPLFPELRKPKGYWNIDMIRDLVKDIKSRKEFSEKYPQAAAWTKANGYWDEITKDWDYLGSLKFRGVYGWEFDDNFVYIGLTDNFDRRTKEHLSIEGSSQVSKHINETGLEPKFIKLSDYLPVKEAQLLEECKIEEYRINGWFILNKAKAGGLGWCKAFWTFDRVKKEALKYNNRSDFKKNSYAAYVIANKNKWMDEISGHMKYKQIQWNESMVRDIALKYDTLTDFLNKEPKAAEAARRMGIYNDVIKDMKRNEYDTTIPKYQNIDKDELDMLLSSYTSISNLRSNNTALYNYISKNNIIDYVRNYYGLSPSKKWTLELLQKEAEPYKSRWEFQKGNASAYQSARRQNYLDILFPINK